MEKYGKDGPFVDPVVRCDKCDKILLKTSLAIRGMCDCGNRRVQNLLGFNLWEWFKMKFIWKIDPEFLKKFTTKKVTPCEKVS